MTDAEKIAFAVAWFEAGQCPGCFAPLPEIDGSGDGHFPDGRAFTSGHGKVSGRCTVTSDDLYSLCLIGSRKVGYHPDSGGSNRTPSGETAPSREKPRPGCFVDRPLSGRGPT